MIIDAHVHITENGRWFNTDYDASVERLITSLEESKIDKAVVLPIAPFISNEFVANACSEYPDELIGFASINPLEKDAARKLEEDVIRYDLKGLKLHPKLQGFRLVDQNVELIIKKAAELRIPVLIDTWVRANDIEYQNLISSVSQLAKKVASVKIILTHLGGFNYNQIPQVARESSNIYFDLSYILAKFEQEIIYNQIVPIMKNIGANRLIYGSDYPEIDIRSYFSFTQKLLNNLGFKRKEKDFVFGDTIRNLIDIWRR